MRKIKQFLRGFGRGAGIFGDNIALIVNSCLLLVVYLVGFGGTSLLAKLVGKRFLDKKVSANNKTYWSDLNLTDRSIEEYYRQF